MSDVTAVHEEKETLAVDINIPGHEPRTTTALFTQTRKALLEREGVCWVCQRTKEEAGPLEAHHYPIERSLANMVDWDRVKADAQACNIGQTLGQRRAAMIFDWKRFDPADPYSFVDDMTVNGLLLCKAHHTGKNEGIHALPHPLWIAQRYGKEGYQFSAIEIIHHEYTADES